MGRAGRVDQRTMRTGRTGRRRAATARTGVGALVTAGWLAVGACADGSGTGWVVLDDRGEPAPGALITVRDTAAGTAVTVYAAPDGTFDVPDGAVGPGRVWEFRSAGAEATPRAVLDGAPEGPVRLAPAAADDEPPASAFLAQLPDGPEKRRTIVDCGGCHTFNARHARLSGAHRPEESWRDALVLMQNMAGQGSGFPIMSSEVDPEADAAWLAGALAGAPWPRSVPLPAALTAGAARAVLTEYDVPEPGDLPHDVAVHPSGTLLVTGMFTHRMYVLDPGSGGWRTVDIPVPNANPRAVDVAPDGRWWVLLGAPQSMAAYDPAAGTWETHAIGMYPHSIDLDSEGRVWFNGHFTVAPELIGSLDPATGTVTRYEVPPPAPRWTSESTIPYGLRVDADDVIWATQLRGNHLIRLDPADGSVRLFEMPTSESGPRRPDLAADGTVWIPGFGAGTLVRFDPASETFTEYPVPDPDAAPYVVRVDRTRGTVWLGTGHGDVVYAFDPTTERFTAYPLPTRGALVRHLDVDEATGAVWAAYGASPGIPGKVLRIQPGGPDAG